MEKKASFITWFFCSGFTFFASGFLLIIGYWAGALLSRRMSHGAFLGPLFLTVAAGILVVSIPIAAIEWIISNKKLSCCNPLILFGINTFLGILAICLTAIIHILGYAAFLPSALIAFYLLPLSFFFFFKIALFLVLFDGNTRRNFLIFNLLLGTISIAAILFLLLTQSNF